MRSPAAHPPRYSSLSVDDLAGIFAEMNMRASARPSRDTKSARKQRKFVSPVVVVPPAAPHPAVVNPRYASPTTITQMSDMCTWQNASLRPRKPTTSRSRASYPSWALPDTPRRRKSSGLPRRSPSTPSNAHRFGTSLRISSTSSSSSISSTASRSTSLSSLSSQTSVESLNIASDNQVLNLDNVEDCTFSTETPWDSSYSSISQYMPLCLPEVVVPGLSQDLTFPDLVTMDVPAFMFFES